MNCFIKSFLLLDERQALSVFCLLYTSKTRGILGEIQLGAILEEILAPEQYETNVATIPAVSYTHLDVYKRQTLCSGSFVTAQGAA